MDPLGRLVGQTAIYGLSSIVGRLINFLLVPLYTRVFLPGEYGVVTEMYTYMGFLLIILTYGMETALFRFSEDKPQKKNSVFSTSLLAVTVTSSVFILLAVLMRRPLAEIMRYPDNVEYIVLLAFIIGLDAFAAIPFARLRAQNKAMRFALLKLTGIGVNICLVLFFLVICPWLMQHASATITQLISPVYDPGIGVGYVFIANLAATSVTLLLLTPVMRSVKLVVDKLLLRQMLLYALPLLVAGLAGWVNEALDKLLLKYILPEDIAMSQVGIYGAVYKLSIMMTIFIQAFRFAAEPFFFAHAKERNARQTYAEVMNYFVMVCLIIFLGITLFIDVVKHFIGPEYHEGLPVVPILLLANMFLGVFFNLSVWYKLTGQTMYGAWFAITGAIITILLNVWWIPTMGYHGSAWATLICYTTLTAISYAFGQRHYKIHYNIPRLFFMIGLAIMLFFVGQHTRELPQLLMYAIHGTLIVFFVVVMIVTDTGLRSVIKSFR